MTTCAGKDSFGQEVNVGDYIYFRVKSQYLPDALSLGRVTEVTTKGTIMLRAINTRNMTIEEYLDHQQKLRDRWEAEAASSGKPMSKYQEELCQITFKQRLNTVTSAVLVPAHALPPTLTQLLQD